MSSNFRGKKKCEWHIKHAKKKKFCDEGDSVVHLGVWNKGSM
jgi:hypothetical protein